MVAIFTLCRDVPLSNPRRGAYNPVDAFDQLSRFSFSLLVRCDPFGSHDAVALVVLPLVPLSAAATRRNKTIITVTLFVSVLSFVPSAHATSSALSISSASRCASAHRTGPVGPVPLIVQPAFPPRPGTSHHRTPSTRALHGSSREDSRFAGAFFYKLMRKQ